MANRATKSDLHESIPLSHWDPDQLTEILNKTHGKKILVIGDVGLDRYTIGNVDRISPEAPVPIVHVQEEKMKLGLAANVADNIQALQGIPFLLGVVGQDRSADDFRGLLDSAGIAHHYLVTDPSRRTVLKERVVSERQQLVRIDYENLNSISAEIQQQILDRVSELLPQVDYVVVEDYAKGMLTPALLQQLMQLVRQEKKSLAVDPHVKTPIRFYSGASVLTPNTKEAEALSGKTISDLASLSEAGFALLHLTGAEQVLVTRGKDGMALFQQKAAVMKLIPTLARDVYDVSGAGDTVISVLALALATGASLEGAAILGNLAAGIEVGKWGTATVSREELHRSFGFLAAGAAQY